MTADVLTPGAEARLRAALDAAATAAPVPPAWEAVHERVELGDAVALRPPRRRGPTLAAAAAVLLLALAGVGVAVSRGDDGDVTAAGGSEAYCEVLTRPARTRTTVTVTVYLHPDTHTETVEAVRALIRDHDGVEGYAYSDGAAALDGARRLFEDDEAMRDLLRPGDVPTSFTVLVDGRDAADALLSRLAGEPGIFDTVVDPEQETEVPDVFTVLVALARADTEAPFSPVEPGTVDAFRSTAPAALGRAVGPTARLLARPRVSSRLGRDAVTTVVADALARCGFDLPPDPRGESPLTTEALPATTTEAAPTSTEPG